MLRWKLACVFNQSLCIYDTQGSLPPLLMLELNRIIGAKLSYNHCELLPHNQGLVGAMENFCIIPPQKMSWIYQEVCGDVTAEGGCPRHRIARQSHLNQGPTQRHRQISAPAGSEPVVEKNACSILM